MSTKPFDLSGKTAMVTGAHSGIGQGIALALAEAGADIVGAGRRELRETEQQVRMRGRRFLALRADLSTLEPIQPLIDAAFDAMGSVDILVNNAGIIRRNDAVDLSEADWDQVIDTNLKSVFFLCQALARRLIAAGRPGKIINIASMLSFQGGIRVASYTASKSGIAGLTRLLANEWAVRGINVNAIAPGYIETQNTEALRTDPQRNRDILARIPAARWGTAADLGGAAVFLASGAADYVHGTVLAVDGGWLAR